MAPNENNKTRIDKWIWAVRIVKSRTLAKEFCEGGKVSINDTSAKPSKLVSTGDIVSVQKKTHTETYRVLGHYEKRVSYDKAIECYKDLTPPREKQGSPKDPYTEQFRVGQRQRGEGRPTKKERRQTDELKSWWEPDN